MFEELKCEVLNCHGVISAALIAPPGPDVVAALAGIDPDTVADTAQVDLLVAWERQAAWVASCAQPVIVKVAAAAEKAAARFGGDNLNDPGGGGRAEIGAALRLSDQTAHRRLEVARALSGRHRGVQQSLAAGDICYLQAAAICEATEHLDDDKAGWVASRVLPKARKQTLAELRRTLRRAVLAVDPKSAAERAKKAHAERTLDWWPLEDGMAEMRLITSAADVKAVYQTVDAWAKAAADGETSTPTDERLPIDARRADALVDLITRHPGSTCSTCAGRTRTAGTGPKVSVQVTIDLPTLLGLRDNPAELTGYGPLPAPLARTLAADGNWRRLIHDPQTGTLLDLGRTSYTPSAELTRYIRARDVVCSFPGCNRPARRCHLDHTRPYTPHNPDGGRTDRNNLGPLCEPHHVLKHKAGWTLRRDPTTEQATWTSPLGHRYPADHHDYRSMPTRDNQDTPIDAESEHQEQVEQQQQQQQQVESDDRNQVGHDDRNAQPAGVATAEMADEPPF